MTELTENLPIGFFDSGVGGLSVYSRFKKLLPNENTIYFGDLAHLPYGNKSKEELIGYARSILNFYQKKNVKAVIIACNTSSAQAYDTIKDEFDFKIYPIIQIFSKVIAERKYNRLGVFATEATVSSKAYTTQIQKYSPETEIIEIACPNWVNIVEAGKINSLEAQLSIRQKVIEMQKNQPEKIILGCTHYPYLMNVLEKYAPKSLFIDPAEIFVEYIKNDLNTRKNSLSVNDSTEEFFVSASPEKFVKNAKIFYDVKILPTIISELETTTSSILQ